MRERVVSAKKTLHVTTRQEWRHWLKKHYKTESEVWLAFHKKETGKPRIPYNVAVEEALCFGWIDSIVRSLDAESFAQRFSRRRPKSNYSQANKVRLRSLIRQKRVQKEVLESLSDILEEKYHIPCDILRAIKANKLAWKNFQKYSTQYKEIRIAYIDGAWKRPKEFGKRLKFFIEMTEKNKLIGFGGINKYY
jgi:uncharacterized protein YdeI (YjbR/CyaY-like superfamily)